jgi:hypothetical protein
MTLNFKLYVLVFNLFKFSRESAQLLSQKSEISGLFVSNLIEFGSQLGYLGLKVENILLSLFDNICLLFELVVPIS